MGEGGPTSGPKFRLTLPRIEWAYKFVRMAELTGSEPDPLRDFVRDAIADMETMLTIIRDLRQRTKENPP